MVKLAHRLSHRLDDFGMRVAENGAHLAGGEIEDRAAMGVIDVAPLGALDDDGRELGPIADEMIACASPELRVIRRACRQGFLHVYSSCNLLLRDLGVPCGELNHQDPKAHKTSPERGRLARSFAV